MNLKPYLEAEPVAVETPTRPMKVCIAGWYFREDFLKSVAASGFDAFVVKHREGNTQGLPSALYPNVGLEFGAYRDYVRNHWDGESDVLFIHDDTDLLDPYALHHAASISTMGVDHAYIFSSAYEELCNGGAHGRCMWMSAETIRRMKDNFPVDETNTGTNGGLHAQQGIVMFHNGVVKAGSNTALAAIIPSFSFGHRGRMNNSVLVFRRVNIIPGSIINA